MGEKTWSRNTEEGGFSECKSRIAVIQRVTTPGYVRYRHLVELVSTRLSSAVRIVIRREEDHQVLPEQVLQRREHRLQGENVCSQCQPYPNLLHPSPRLRFFFTYNLYNTSAEATTTVPREPPSRLVSTSPI